MNIKRSNRVCCFGQTGSGKTTIARGLWIGQRGPKICIDVKQDLEDMLPGIPTIESPSEIDHFPTVRAVPPSIGDERWYAEIYRRALQRGDTYIWLDEANEISKPSYIPEDVRRFLLQGRSRECGHIACTPRPADVNPSFATQSEHIFICWMPHDLDRKAAARLAGFRSQQQLDELLDELEDFGSLYVPTGSRSEIMVCEPLPHPDELTARIASSYYGPYDSGRDPLLEGI